MAIQDKLYWAKEYNEYKKKAKKAGEPICTMKEFKAARAEEERIWSKLSKIEDWWV